MEEPTIRRTDSKSNVDFPTLGGWAPLTPELFKDQWCIYIYICVCIYIFILYTYLCQAPCYLPAGPEWRQMKRY